jgi:putative hydrolase of the HAD superfamily
MGWNIAESPEVVCFDLDDTIIDFGSSARGSWRAVCAEAAARTPGLDGEALDAAVERIRRWYWSDAERHRVGRSDLLAASTRIVAQALDEIGHRDGDLARATAIHYRDVRDAAICLFEGAVETLRWLAARDVRLALVTNGTSLEQRAKLERFDLGGHFEHVAIEGEVGVGKPDPRAFELALSRLACEPGECWMVGDNLEWDVAAPQSLGMRAVWVDTEGRGLPDGAAVRPDHIVRSIRELIPAV